MKLTLDENVADCSYITLSGGIAVDIVKLASTEEGKRQLKLLLESLNER